MMAIAHQYETFDLQLRPARDGAYEAAVLRSPVGEVRRIFTLPLTAEELTAQVEHVKQADEGSVDRAKVLGGMLFSAIFGERVLQVYDRSVNHVQGHGCDLRIRLRVLDDSLLAALPWELLFDVRQQRFIALQPDTVLVRTLETQQPLKPLDGEPRLRVLAMAVQPSNLDALDLAAERQQLTQALARLGDSAHLHWVEGQGWRDLQDALQRGDWHIFHFLGHGLFDPTTATGYLAFADAAGAADLRSAEEIARLLGDHNALRLAVLNACAGAQGGSHMNAGIAQQLVSAGLPAVVAVQQAIADREAIELARSFYTALGNGLPIDAAFAEARKALSLAAPETLAWAALVLVTRSAEESRPVPSRLAALPVPRWSIWAVLFLLLLAVGLVAWQAWPQIQEHFGPVRMPEASFNVAVAPFTPLVRNAEGKRSAETEATELAQRVAAALNNASGDWTELFEGGLLAWGPQKRIRLAAGADARQYMEKINANLLIYGELDREGQRWKLTPEFRFDDAYAGLRPELEGSFAFGSEIEYRASAAGIQEVNRALRDRALSFAGIALGYSYLIEGEEDAYARAVEVIEWVRSHSSWVIGKGRNAKGQETFYLFLGNAYLQLAYAVSEIDPELAFTHLASAEDAFEQGLAINPTYARLLAAQASARYQRISRFGSPGCDNGWIEQANRLDRDFQRALQQAENDPLITQTLTENLVKMFSYLGIGRTQMWRFRCTRLNSHFAEQANQAYQQVLDLYEEIEQADPGRAPHYAESAIFAHAEGGQMLLVEAALLTRQNGSPAPVEEVIDHWQAAEQLAQQRDNPENLSTVHTNIIDACEQSRLIAPALFNSSVELERYCVQVSERG
ncbi:MAG: CHAT domain-containing protein [Caldilineaceae bacterium]|nr:CHAT domain-containing protein [Caldilineaceae bacterium]